MSIPDVGDVFALKLQNGRYGACQVIADRTETLELMAFAKTFAKRPTVKQALASKPLILTHHFHKGAEVQRIRVTKGAMPPLFIPLGNAAPACTPETPGNSYSGPDYLAHQIMRQAHWDALPKAVVRAFDSVIGSDATRAVSLGGEPSDVPESSSDITVELGDRAPDWASPTLRAPAKSVDWAGLDALPALTKLELYGWSKSLPGYLGDRPLIRTLCLYDDELKQLDLSRSCIDEVYLSTPKLETLKLAPETTEIQFNSCLPKTVRLAASDVAPRLTLHQSKRIVAALPRGLPSLASLEVVRAPGFDPCALTGAKPIRKLTLNEVSKVKRFEQLLTAGFESLTLIDCYGFDVTKAVRTMPRPDLHLSFDGVRKSTADLIKKAWKGHPHLEIRGVKGDAWLEANIDSPFRDWVDFDRPKGEAACKAYAAAMRKVSKMKRPKKSDLEPVLKSFVKALNRLEAEHGIDTLEREHALDGFEKLLTKAGTKNHQPWLERFEQWREF